MAPTDIITIQNLEQRLPPWDPESSSLFAIVDMGSNGIRFSITSLASHNARLLRPVYSSRAAISLFDALTPAESGLVFPDSTIASVASTLADFYHIALAHGVPKANVMILATEAMRRAANGGRMLEAIAHSTEGLGVHILDPAVETLCGAVMGSRSCLGQLPAEGALFLDLGGGSVQITWVDPSDPDYGLHAANAGVSLPFGAARLIRILKHDDATVRTEQIETLSTGLSIAYDSLCKRFPRLQDLRRAYQAGDEGAVDVFMCGGGFRGYGSMLMHADEIQPYPFATVNTYSVSAAHFKQTSRMRIMNENTRGAIFGLSSRRREQFPAIATVIEAFINAVPNIRSVTFCGGSNREGALMMKLPREIRESNPLDALASANAHEMPALNAIAELLRQAIPEEVRLSKMPTIFSTGLTLLVLKETWCRQGYDADANTSFALRYAITRDTDTPGLSHRNRALLALTLYARWGGNLCSADAQLSKNLQAILDREAAGTSSMAFYIGGVLRSVTEVFPILPADADQVINRISIESCLKHTPEKRDRLSSTIIIHGQNQALNAEKMSKRLKETINSAEQKSTLKIEVQVVIKS